MKGRPVEQLVYEQMFPKPRPGDPTNFHALLQRHLIQEVRHEVHSFYGHIDTMEAKYPGLDYTHRIHRLRLSRWQWHRRLFRAFDALRLTPYEIAGLTKWEGTKWAKDRYESETGQIIVDTTDEGFPDYRHGAKADRETRSATPRPTARAPSQVTSTPASSTALPVGQDEEEDDDEGQLDEDDEEEEEEDDGEDDELIESVGIPLNEQLIERLAMRDAGGDMSMPLDEEWEQWYKNAVETGELSNQIAQFSQHRSRLLATDIFPQRMVAAARAGDWDSIPDFLRDMIRNTLNVEDQRVQAQPTQSPMPAASQAALSSPTRPFRLLSSAATTLAPLQLTNSSDTQHNSSPANSSRTSSVHRILPSIISSPPIRGSTPSWRHTQSGLRLPQASEQQRSRMQALVEAVHRNSSRPSSLILGGDTTTSVNPGLPSPPGSDA